MGLQEQPTLAAVAQSWPSPVHQHSARLHLPTNKRENLREQNLSSEGEAVMVGMSLSYGEPAESLYEAPYLAIYAGAKPGEELHLILPATDNEANDPIYVASLREIVADTIQSCSGDGQIDFDCAEPLAALALLFQNCADLLRTASRLKPHVY